MDREALIAQSPEDDLLRLIMVRAKERCRPIEERLDSLVLKRAGLPKGPERTRLNRCIGECASDIESVLAHFRRECVELYGEEAFEVFT